MSEYTNFRVKGEYTQFHVKIEIGVHDKPTDETSELASLEMEGPRPFVGIVIESIRQALDEVEIV